MVAAGQQATPVQYSGQPTGPGGQPAARPLFPSAAAGQPGPSPKTAFPAYSGDTDNSGDTDKKPAMIATTGGSSKIIHPPEDISLVSQI